MSTETVLSGSFGHDRLTKVTIRPITRMLLDQKNSSLVVLAMWMFGFGEGLI